MYNFKCTKLLKCNDTFLKGVKINTTYNLN